MVFNTGAALLDAIVLAVVSREDEGTYGYKITQDVRKAIDVSESTLYPVLRRLQKGEYLEVYDRQFDGRNRRPPLDRVNAALSMTYTLLAHDCASALESVGLDAYVGFMHRDRPGRTSLALDLMEELRAPLADRFVLTLINTRVLQQKHFKMQVDGAVWLTDDGRKALLSAWQNRKKEEITHPFLKEKMAWGLVPYVQALLLARYLRGDMDEYPPFLWK